MAEPLGIDEVPSLSWKLKSGERDMKQTSYHVEVMLDNELVRDSGVVESDAQSFELDLELKQRSEYIWRVTVTDNKGNTASASSRFETGLMGNYPEMWSGAKWIGSPRPSVNTDGLDHYAITAEFESEGTVGIAVNARDRDNYLLVEVDTLKRRLEVREYNDNAWTTRVPTVMSRGREEFYEIHSLKDVNTIRIEQRGRMFNVSINDELLIDHEQNFIPRLDLSRPRRQTLMKFGLKQENDRAVYHSIRIEGTHFGSIYQNETFEDNKGVLSALGEVVDGKLIVENRFDLVNPVPALNFRKKFFIEKDVARARIYSASRGFYDMYVNRKRINEGYYNSGFTDYRKRIMYQTFDITKELHKGINTMGSIVTKGYYTGYVGYSLNPMIYGRENSFILKAVIEYTDGTSEMIVTDQSWQFSGKGPVNDADYQQGEHFDGRLAIDEESWEYSGVIQNVPEFAEPTNGYLDEYEPFELCAQYGPEARVERVLKPLGEPVEMPEGCFVYDFGQNMVGTVRIQARGNRGESIKFRYGEISRRNGEMYLENLRCAANTDTMVFSGKEVDKFEPSLTQHGFRYVEVSGNGQTLTRDDLKRMIVSIEGLVLTNTTEIMGGFECSNEDINKLQSNIQWGQRGNSLLVFTDCPQRNERMGWTGDAEVFARTAAYNMNVKAFMNKWLRDLRDAQKMYNRGGAVPDTAPLGGDNRPMGGCAGWGDAAVIVPWEMYQAYGDKAVLRDNYEMMKAWVNYQSSGERQDFGLRVVDGNEVPEQSDLATVPYIQVQQSRGDHLAYDRSTPFILTATAYAAYVAKLLSKAATVLGYDADAARYEQRFENVRRAFNDAWVREDGSIAYWGEQSINGINKTYYSHDGGDLPSQTAYAVAIDFDLIPDDKLEKTAQFFKQTIEHCHGKLSVGFLGISHLAPALEKAGLTDHAFALLEQTENPSWLYSVKNGATTIWERWSSYMAETDTFGDVAMNSFNHYSYGAIGQWMMGTIAGIKPAEPGYSRVRIEPHIGGHLDYVKAWHNTPRGIVRSEWKRSGDKVSYSFEVPPNTEAEIALSGREVMTVGSGKYEIEI